MRNAVVTVLNAVDTGSANGAAIAANQIVSASFHVVFGDVTAVGIVRVQASNDFSPSGTLMPDSFTVTNWVDVPSATVSPTAGGQYLITITQSAYQWLRVVWTRTSGGSTTIVVNMNSLSV